MIAVMQMHCVMCHYDLIHHTVLRICSANPIPTHVYRARCTVSFFMSMDDTAEGGGYLQDVWTYYFHDPEDSNWNLDSYRRLGDVSTVEDACLMHEALLPLLSQGMFFLMREHVYPCWDDPNNMKGGCLSLKVPKDSVHDTWQDLTRRMLGEHLLISHKAGNRDDGDEGDLWSTVNGISVSPKRFFSIVKLWLRDERYTDRDHFALPESYNAEVIYRSNIESIRGTQQVAAPLPSSTLAHGIEDALDSV